VGCVTPLGQRPHARSLGPLRVRLRWRTTARAQSHGTPAPSTSSTPRLRTG